MTKFRTLGQLRHRSVAKSVCVFVCLFMSILQNNSKY